MIPMVDWFSGIANNLGLTGWMVTPWLFVAGALLVSVPIIIHLLNKRRFKTIDWAAMDFLLEADKKNHRRVRIENLLMLLLRCLAVLLIALLVARPHRPKGLFGDKGDVNNFNRIVILDDSLSMGARGEGQIAFDRAKKRLVEFVNGLARNNSNDYLTVILASSPRTRIAALNKVLVSDKASSDDGGTGSKGEVVREIKQLELSDRPAQLAIALEEARKITEDAAPENNSSGGQLAVDSVIYVISDLRAGDWAKGETPEWEQLTTAFKAFAKKENNCYLVNVGAAGAPNIAVSDIVPLRKMLVSGVETEFDVFVTNHGSVSLADVKVRFTVGTSPPVTKPIKTIAAGGKESIRFRYTFAAPAGNPEESGTLPESIPIKAEVLTNDRPDDDHLAADNVRYFAARVHRAVSVLLVDGDPRDDPTRSETFYLQRALRPTSLQAGDARSGFQVKVVRVDELKKEKLDDYQLIFLANVFQLEPTIRAGLPAKTSAAKTGAGPKKKTTGPAGDRESLLKRLEDWTRNGGRLVITLGDQIDARIFNDDFYRFGRGLSPLKLVERKGDEEEKTWAELQIEDKQNLHPTLDLFYQDGVSALQLARFFRWWHAEPPRNASVTAAVGSLGAVPADSVVSVPLSLLKVEKSPAIAEKPFGKGRTVLITTAIDADWNNWTHDDPTFPIYMLELGKYLTPESAKDATVTVGQPLEQAFNGNRYDLTTELTGPDGNKTPLRAQAIPGKNGKGQSLFNRFRYADADRRGFYKMPLGRIGKADNQPDDPATGKTEMLFAANVATAEGNLKALDHKKFEEDLAVETVKIVEGAQLSTLGDSGAEGELWLWVLLALVLVLFTEQLLGWYFGTKR